MATVVQSAPLVRAQSGYPPASLRFDWISAGLSVLLMVGLNVDIWAHNHDKVDNTFFTPWHAVMYGAFFIFGLYLTLSAMRNITRGYGLMTSLPRGYMLSLLGTFIFAFGGVGDMIWHTVFGIEQNTEALLSPTHLLLGTGFFLLFSGTIRSAWYRTEKTKTNQWVSLLPAVIGVAMCASLLMAFTQFANSTYNGAYAGTNWVRDSRAPGWLTLPLGISGILIQTAIMMGGLLFLVRNFRLPFGAVTLIVFVPGLLISFYQDTFQLLPGFLAAGVIGDVLLLILQPSAERQLQTGLFAFLVPAVYFTLFFISLNAIQGIGWRVHAWTGAIVFAGVTGLMVALLQSGQHRIETAE